MTYKIYADGELLYSTNNPDQKQQLINPTLSLEIGKSGGLSFTVPPSHPLYYKLKNQLTILKVEEDGECIFRGRLFDTNSDFYNKKQCQGEGDLNFLSDSCVPKMEVKESIKALFTRCINEHNSRVEDYKKFTIGTISVDNADTEKVDIKYTSYQYTMDVIQNDLLDSYGGYLRTRSVGNTNYIDYIQNYTDTAAQTIEFGVNLIDLSSAISPEDIFTIFIPYGDDDLTISSVNGGKDYIEVEGGIEKWGRIYKIERFSGISDANTLMKEATLYIKNRYDGSPQTITLTAVDMKHLGVDLKSIRIGDKTRIVSKPHGIDKVYTCTSISYDFLNPGRTQYVFGKPKQEFTKKYNNNNRDTQGSIDDTNSRVRGVGGAAAATASKLDQYIIATDEQLLLMHDNIQLNGKQIDLLAQETNDGFNTIQIDMDAMNARLVLTATKEYVDGQYDEVSVSLDAANRRIDINAQDIVEINSDLTKINGDLVVLGKTFTDELEAMKGDISWLNTKHISCTGLTSTYGSFSESLAVTGNTTISGTAFVNSLSLDGSPVSKTTLPVVTAFTQASGQTAPTTNYTLLTTSVANGVAHQPTAGSTVNF